MEGSPPSATDSELMSAGIRLRNEPNNLSHWDFQIDPEWRQFSTMIADAARAIKERAPDLPLARGGISLIDPNFIKLLTGNEHRRQDLAGHVLETVRRRHHCDLRAEQLEETYRTLTAKVG